MKLHCVFMGSIYIKGFKTLVEADICALGIQMWLADHAMDTNIVCIKEEVMN